MNVFLKKDVADNYDSYYQTEFGGKVDAIEKEIISELLKEIPKEKMLELGCGTGHWTEVFIDQGFKVTGIDISEAMLSIARGKNLDAELRMANSESLPFVGESFDSIASITMLEFIENQEKAIHEMFRVLKPGGYLIMGFLNADSQIGINKDNDETFKNANLLKISDIESKFKQFNIVQLKEGVYLNQDFAVLDNSNKINNTPPVFIGALFQKQQK